MMADASTDLIAEQLSHALDLIKSENAATRARLDHESEVLRLQLTELKNWKDDAEQRLRAVQDSATQFKVLAGLATGGGLVSLVALLKVLTGI
jgi:hypothetical protein